MSSPRQRREKGTNWTERLISIHSLYVSMSHPYRVENMLLLKTCFSTHWWSDCFRHRESEGKNGTRASKMWSFLVEIWCSSVESLQRFRVSTPDPPVSHGPDVKVGCFLTCEEEKAYKSLFERPLLVILFPVLRFLLTQSLKEKKVQPQPKSTDKLHLNKKTGLTWFVVLIKCVSIKNRN